MNTWQTVTADRLIPGRQLQLADGYLPDSYSWQMNTWQTVTAGSLIPGRELQPADEYLADSYS